MQIRNPKIQPALVVGDCLDLVREHSQPIALSNISAKYKHSEFDVGISSKKPRQKDTGIPEDLPELMLTGGQFIAKKFKLESEAWKYRNQINLFYHNLLTHFVYVYLNQDRDYLDQISDLLDNLDHSPDDIVLSLLKNKMNTVYQIENIMDTAKKDGCY